MAYLTKNPNGVIFLWNNKPHYNDYGETYMAWIRGYEGKKTEIPIDVTGNDYFRSVFEDEDLSVVEITIKTRKI